MKTINSKKPNKNYKEIQIFVDQETDEVCGFAGIVELYDLKVYIDTRDGTGYDMVIDKLKPLICKFAMKYRLSGNTFEDTRHDIIVHILEGIPKYDSQKNTKLSTFIEMRINRRMINELRNRSRISRNATYLNVGIYNVSCDCGNSFIVKVDQLTARTCIECGMSIQDIKKKVPVNTPEINESILAPSSLYENCNGSLAPIHNKKEVVDDGVIFTHDMQNWLKNEDPRVVKIVELIYFRDYSIKAAAEEVGLSGAGANMKLKELSKNKIVRELFGR